MNYPTILDLVSKEVGLPKEVVSKTYKAYWFFIKLHIQSLPLKDNLDENDFAKLQTNFNIPSLGKLNCTYTRVLGMRKRLKLINEIKHRKK